MKFLILFLFSIISIALVAFQSEVELSSRSRLLLRQEIQLLENNTLKNILIEQNLSKRNAILENALLEIKKIRENSALQLKKDEKMITKSVQNLKAMSSQNQALYKEVL